MSDNKIIKIGISQGDINGIGTEVIIKALMDNRMGEMYTLVIYGSSKAFSYYKKGIEGAENFSLNVISSAAEAKPRKNNLVEAGGRDLKITPGEATAEAGAAAVAFLRTATEDLKKGNIDVLVTAPINKENVQSKEFSFTGHTEFLAAQLGGEPLMMMCSDAMRVGLATIHIPLAQVSPQLTTDLLTTKLHALKSTLIQDFRIVNPRIAVLALNPHAGDGGLLGAEEDQVIKPAIAQAYNKGVLCFGPFAADGFFGSAAFRKYDAVLAMYHDQGLAPFKALTPYGVNYTAGLPNIRTSPDHGVAYDIAGKDSADAASMREAIYLAADIYRARTLYREISAKPLRRYERERGGADISVRDMKLPDAAEE